MEEKILKQALEDLPIPIIRYFEETDSTNEQALGMAASGAEDNTLVIAEKQTAGRGRMGRCWVTAPGSSLAFSLIFKPTKAEEEYLGLFSMLGALAVCRAIQEQFCADAQVKWPNDVLLGGMKTAGILAESCWQGDTLAGLVLGIGINLLPGSVPPAEKLLFPATCVQAHCSKPVNRLIFLEAVLRHVFTLRKSITKNAFIVEYARHLAFIGRRITLSSTAGNAVSGVLAGVERDGQIILQMDDGERKAYPIGDVHLRPDGS